MPCGSDWAFDIPTAMDTSNQLDLVLRVESTVTNSAVPRCPKLFSVTRTWSATDACGNVAFCNQTVTIADTAPPDIACAPNKEVACGSDWSFDIPTATDACDLNNLLIEVVSTVTNIATSRCPKLFSVTRTWRATDTCGNGAFCNQTVTVVDAVPPRLVCADDRFIEHGFPWAFTPPSAVDICDGTNVTLAIVSTVTNAFCSSSFISTRTWQATDGCGNRSICSQRVFVLDTMPPSLNCASDRVVKCGTPWAFNEPAARDLADGTNVTVAVVGTVTNWAFGDTLIATRTWSAIDQCGNTAYCSQSVAEEHCGGTPITIGPPTLLGDGQVQLPIAGDIGRSYTVEACSDLNGWARIATVPNNDGMLRFSDPESLGTLRRFYRARLAP